MALTVYVLLRVDTQSSSHVCIDVYKSVSVSILKFFVGRTRENKKEERFEGWREKW